MGLDLTLLPFEFEDFKCSFSHTVLTLDRWEELFEKLMKVERDEVPDCFSSYVSRDDKYEESHYGKTVETAYGEPLKYAKVKDFLKFRYHDGIKNSHRNKAVWAYLKQLPENTKVALYWH